MYADARCIPRQGSWLFSRDLCVRCGDTRLRSSSRGDFVVQRTRLRLAEKSFSVAGPRARLPSHIRTLVSRDSFSRHLKIHFSSSPTTFSDLFLFTLLCCICLVSIFTLRAKCIVTGPVCNGRTTDGRAGGRAVSEPYYCQRAQCLRLSERFFH